MARSISQMRKRTGMKAIVGIAVVIAAGLTADPLACNLDHYKSAPGLIAKAANDALTVVWDGDHNQELRLELVIENQTPTIRELAVRAKGGKWNVLLAGVIP